MDAEQLAHAQQVIGHTFEDLTILELALTHASVSESRLESNERLEFLGDAVLGMVVCERIFHLYPRLLEGEMTKIKSTAVSRKTCFRVADEMGLIDLLELGKGMQSEHELPKSLGAAVLESIIAAIYLDGGYEAANAFLSPIVDPLIQEAARSGHQQNFKSVLQQHAQQRLEQTPTYRILDEKGPDHAKAFKVAVELDGHVFESTWANSKKQAEQQAALNALTSLGVIEENDNGELRVVK